METLSRKELHSKVHNYLSTLYSEDLVKIPLPIVIIGNRGIGKTSIIAEEAASLGCTIIDGEFVRQSPEPSKMVCNEYEKFYHLSAGYYSAEHFDIVKDAIFSFIMTKAIPMYSELKDQKALIIEIDCMKDEAEAIEHAFKSLPVYYYKLTKEDWKEWAETIDPITHEANVEPLIVQMALSTTEFEQ